jgi:hypothetical protein
MTGPIEETRDMTETKSLDGGAPDFLAALQTIADAIRTGTAVLTNDTAIPTANQARSILDYLVMRQLLGRSDGVNRLVAASREGNKIRFPSVPAEVALVAVHTDDGKAPEVRPLDAPFAQSPSSGSTERTVTLNRITNRQPLIRIELQRADGLPILLGPRLPGVPA